MKWRRLQFTDKWKVICGEVNLPSHANYSVTLLVCRAEGQSHHWPAKS